MDDQLDIYVREADEVCCSPIIYDSMVEMERLASHFRDAVQVFDRISYQTLTVNKTFSENARINSLEMLKMARDVETVITRMVDCNFSSMAPNLKRKPR